MKGRISLDRTCNIREDIFFYFSCSKSNSESFKLAVHVSKDICTYKTLYVYFNTETFDPDEYDLKTYCYIA